MLLVLSNCRKEKILTDSSAKVEFSSDTLVFDTVFSTIGSTYRRFTVHNRHNSTLNLSSVRLGKGTGSQFRMNVDGLPGVNVIDIEIPAKDSIYVFVEVTIDPNNANNPFVVEDDIYFSVNGNTQMVHLAAWGQNAYFHFNELVCGETWATDKPHVLYGITAVGFPGLASNCTLTIPAGAIIYAHTDAVLYVYQSKLNINGTATNKVVFQGDRRESSFANTVGQWFGIRFAIGQNSVIKHCQIKNATAGLYIDTLFGTDSIKLENVESFNHSFASLFAQGAKINATNCRFSRAENNAVALRLGGQYSFNHCTIDNYWTETTRSTPALVLNNYYQSGGTIFGRDLERATFNNCIIYGNNDNELVVDSIIGVMNNYRFNHCIIKTDQPTNSKFVQVKKNNDPRFVSGKNHPRLRSSSPAIGAADPTFYLPFDLDLNPRSNPADIGCFEYVP